MAVSRQITWLVLQIFALNFEIAAGNFATKLFQEALPIAERSLYGSFITQMADGTLPLSSFKKYLDQDNLYLGKYARAFAVLAAKAEGRDEFVWFLNKSLAFLGEHGNTTDQDQDDFDQKASPVTVAYTSFLLQAAWGDSMVYGLAAVLPCQKLYDWLFSTLKSIRPISEDNPYKRFIDQYADPSNHGLTLKLEAFIDKYARMTGHHSLLEHAQSVYNKSMQYEADFFAQGVGSGSDDDTFDLSVLPLSHARNRYAVQAPQSQVRALFA